MASETEGIALLSMYNDEEDEDEDEDEEERAEEHGGDDGGESSDETPKNNRISVPFESAPDNTPQDIYSRTPPCLSDEDSDSKTLKSPIPQTPPPPTSPLPQSQISLPFTLPSPSPPPPPPPFSISESLDVQRTGRGSLAIVDYDHDETAMSPEPEEGEIVSGGHVMFGGELQTSDGSFEERTPPGTVQILTPSTQSAPQPTELPDQSKTETSTTMDLTGTGPEAAQVEVDTVVSVEIQKDVDPLKNFLPPPLTAKCPEELQEKINKFLAYKRAGKSFNADLRNRKDYRNPDFLQHAVTYQEIDQIGSCFSKDVFDPRGYDKSDYYLEIEADMKRELEKKEQERKKGQKVDFVAGGTQPATIAAASKLSTQIPGVTAAATSGLQSVSTVVDSMARDARQNKKTKWDKVDGDVRNPLHSGGHDNASTAGVHAALLSAANAGAGYTAFAQQKRREAEEKRSSERKFERRS